jgi:hypothetical protein
MGMEKSSKDGMGKSSKGGMGKRSRNSVSETSSPTPSHSLAFTVRSIAPIVVVGVVAVLLQHAMHAKQPHIPSSQLSQEPEYDDQPRPTHYYPSLTSASAFDDRV